MGKPSSVSVNSMHDTSTDDTIKDNKTPDNKEKKKSIPVHQLFRFASGLDALLIAVALLCSAATGALLPVTIIIFGKYLNVLVGTITSSTDIVAETLPVILVLVYLGIGLFVAAYISQCAWIISGER
jgi:cadmium resistance protein CadD (predicted permease)